MKNKLILFLLIAILLIPSYFALYLYFSAVNDPVEESAVTELTLTSPDGESKTFSRDVDAENEMINYFISISDKSRAIANLPTDLSGSAHYKAVFSSYGKKTEYNYYFSKTKPSNSYFTDNTGKAFRIPAATVIEFLDSKYSSYMYPGAVPPSLTIDNQKFLPYYIDWHYYTYSNVTHTVSAQVQPNNPHAITASYRNFGLKFDRFADKVNISVKRPDGSVYFDGLYSVFEKNGCFSSVNEDCKFSVSIHAVWNDSAAIGYGGSSIYKFDLDIVYDPPGTFWLGEDLIESGEFTVLSGINVEFPEKIKCTVTPSIDYTPVFYKDGDCVRAVIPFPISLGNETRSYTINVEYLGIETPLTVTVKKNRNEFKESKYNYDDNPVHVNVAARTDKNVADFISFINSQPFVTENYIQGAFTVPQNNIRAKYGDTINNTSSSKDRFLSCGYAIYVESKNEIHAVNYGTVVSIGTTEYGGNTVVVDHGLGIRSVYYCLRNVSVTVGEFVKPGTVIGTGSTKSAGGYTDGITAYVELWVHSTPVSLDFLSTDGRLGGVVYGEVPSEKQ